MKPLTSNDLIPMLSTVLREIDAELGPEVPLHRIRALLAVMASPGLYQADLDMKTVGVSQPAVSRSIRSLSGVGRAEVKYPALVVATDDPTYASRKIVTPTARAHALFNRITEKVNAILQRSKS